MNDDQITHVFSLNMSNNNYSKVRLLLTNPIIKIYTKVKCKFNRLRHLNHTYIQPFSLEGFSFKANISLVTEKFTGKEGVAGGGKNKRIV